MSKIKSLKVRAVRVPMVQPHRTAGGVVSESPLVLTDVFSDDGIVGHSIVFTYTDGGAQTHCRVDPESGRAHPGRAAGPARNRAEALQAVPAARHSGARWHRARRDRHGSLGRPRARHETSLVGLLGGVAKPVPAYGAVGYDGAEGPPRWRRNGSNAGSRA